MDLEVKGVAASPRRQTPLSLMGKKRQGWRPDTRATHGPRPPGVPSLDLGRLGDSDGEDEDSYLPYSETHPYTCHLDCRMSLQTPYAQPHQAQEFKQVSRKSCQKKTEHSVVVEKAIPENLPSPTDKYKLKYHQYEAGMKEEHKQYSQRTAEKKKDQLWCPEASIKENLAAERRKQAVIEQVMLDQLSRAVISDPEQSTHADVYKEAHGLLGPGRAPVCFRKRTLHETQNGRDACRELIGIFFVCDRSLTVYEFRRFGKNRTNALPFIQKGVYQHQRGKKKGKAYDLNDFYIGANLTFRSVDHNLPESVKQNPVLTLRVISIDEADMDFLKAPSMELKQECSKQEIDDNKVFKKIQGILRETLSKRGVRLITGLGKYFRQVDKNRNGLLSQADFKEALKVFHLEIPERDFETLWLILDDSESDKVDYGEFTSAIFGEMNEYRKTFVRKAYMKLDFNKTGNVPVVDIIKSYCAKKHPLVLEGKATEEEIKSSFLEALKESCSNPNEVSYSEFEDYYEGLSTGIVNDDDFVNILRNTWGI